MKRISILLFLVLAAHAAHGDPRVELGVAAGGHDFSKSSELGANDDAADPGPMSGAMFGVRAALPLPFYERLAVEGELMIIPTRDDVLHDGATVYDFRGHLRFDLLTGRIRPFLLAGAGVQTLRSSSMQLLNDTDEEFHVGAGLRWAMNDHVDLRVDLRDLIVPDRSYNGATDDYEMTAGVTWRFGSDERPAPPPLPRPPGDRDGDGLTDDVDQCPDKPEDKDGFQDADGCPDPDNDHDGIADADDKCPNEPETKNGYQDADGCPDQLITELAGIGFQLDSAKLDDQSTPILDHAVQILTDNPTISVEISGHTSSEGDPKRNQALSLARADAVEAYLVAHGIDAARIRTVGHGSDLPVADNATEEGRRQNRRIEFKVLTADPR